MVGAFAGTGEAVVLFREIFTLLRALPSGFTKLVSLLSIIVVTNGRVVLAWWYRVSRLVERALDVASLDGRITLFCTCTVTLHGRCRERLVGEFVVLSSRDVCVRTA